jgi:hypothetical protein
MKRLVLLLLLSAGTPLLLTAQWPSLPAAVDSGRVVRVTTLPDHRRLTGRLLARYARTDADLLLCPALRPCRAPGDSAAVQHISSSQLLRLEVRTGDHAMTGLLYGGITGAALFALAAGSLHGLCDSNACGTQLGDTIRGGLIGGVAFGFLGGLVGTLIPRWGPAP